MDSTQHADEWLPHSAEMRDPASAPARLDQFRALVLAAPSLQETLRRPDEVEQFIALTMDTARACGLALSPETVRLGLHGHLPGMGGPGEDDLRETPLPPDGWIPIGTSWQRD